MFGIPPLVVGEALARSHMEELRRDAAAHQRSADHQRSAAHQRSGAGRRRRRSVRTTAGWFLVRVGMQLALPRPAVSKVAR